MAWADGSRLEVANVKMIDTAAPISELTSSRTANQSSPGRSGSSRSSALPTTREETMADISDHTLIRHQYQRRMSGTAMPPTMTAMYFTASSTPDRAVASRTATATSSGMLSRAAAT